ncbi:MAG: Dam family site-specific DNA-(adenine-N6)-methyltransferase [Melioribacteraceae bacterium]|nr:Dam family site-specific DNA-(adenine-N6)-methyltransferase [Melioribacteraceae bacterium]
MYNNTIINEINLAKPQSLFKTSMKPFLKWAGGKSQLIPELEKYIPLSFNKYIEPFIGGGAFYFFLNPAQPIISDLNEELIITYEIVKNNVEELIHLLQAFKNEEKYYYNIRSQNPENLTNIERAARMIFLNKTCFNGLYRVNKKGEFNVPFGKRNGEFLNATLLREASDFLQNAEIIHSPYSDVLLNNAEKGDFIFLDPPYYPVSKYSDFKRYTKEFFYHEDHLELKKEFDRLVKLGCYVILTNSDHPEIIELYSEYNIKIIETKRLISSNPKTRDGKDIIVLGNL